MFCISFRIFCTASILDGNKFSCTTQPHNFFTPTQATALATDAAVLREKAAAILELATRVKVTDGSESARKLLIRTLLAPAGKNIETPEQIAAAVKFVQAQDKVASVRKRERDTCIHCATLFRTLLSTRRRLPRRRVWVWWSMKLLSMRAPRR